tara:strand:+ start:26795 stop:27094 length:300 start_codon:yes stop_codon:yes gene_type:complete
MLLDDGKTNCIMYRRTNPQLLGGLWPNARAIYEQMPKGSEPKAIRDHKMEVVFPNGAKIKYQQAENVARSKMDAQGQEFTFVGIDEGKQCAPLCSDTYR